MCEEKNDLLKEKKKKLTFNRKKMIKWTAIILSAMIVIFVVYFYFSLPDVSNLKNQNPKLTALMQIRINEAELAGKKLRIRQKWVRFKKIPKLLRQTIRITEDASFYKHEGVDYEELRESIKKNWDKGKFARGGSTITQQLAKNLYLSTEKSLFRKIREYFIAKRLESTLSKNRIYHLYLNVIELGRGVFGVEAASWYYFNKSVSDLSLEEMVRLTSVIPKPLTRRPTVNSRWVKWKSKWILGKLKKYKYIDAERYEGTIGAFITKKKKLE